MYYLEYKEGLSRNIGRHNKWVCEPCNYVSNVAYYHASTKICAYGDNWSCTPKEQNALKRMFANLAAMSAFWHSSFTRNGHTYDN